MHNTQDQPFGPSSILKFSKEYKHKGDRTGWVKNNEDSYSYLIRIFGDTYVLSKKTVTEKEYFKYILQGDRRGDDSK